LNFKPESNCGTLATDGWRIGLQEVARTTCCVVRVGDLSSRWSLSTRTTVTATVCVLTTVSKEALVVCTASLPTELAWAASEWTVACIALVVLHVVAAGATQ